jgi:small-conductance mechanosensitive channel
MKLQEIRHAIKFGSFTNDELNTLSEAIRFARTELVHEVKRGLSIGDNVNFTSSRTGKNITGVVEKIAVKYVTVRTVEGGWRVPANMLSAV